MLKRLLVGRRPRRTALRVTALIAASLLVFGVVLRPIRARGISMVPTIADGDLVFLNTLAYVLDRPVRRGDIVGIRLAGPNVFYVKRVVALPYEEVAIRDGQLIVDRRPIDEPYVRHRAPWQYAEVRLGQGEYFVIGDNRGMRQELHDFGRVSRPRIRGKVVFW